MKRKLYLSTLAAALLAVVSYAAVERRSLDLHLPTQQLLEKQTISAPGATSTNAILSANAGATSAAAVTVSSFSAQPDVSRNLFLKPGGSTSNLASCVVTISGTSINNTSISETFTFTAAQNQGVIGAKAFKTVTSVAFPASCENAPYGTTWDLGYGSKLGLKKCMANAASFFHAAYNGVKETTAPTVVASASAVEGNTIVLNTTLSGSDVLAFFTQNFACQP